MHKRNPSSFTPMLDNRYLLLGGDSKLNHAEISKFSKSDADKYDKFLHKLDTLVDFIDPILDQQPITLRGDNIPRQLKVTLLRQKMEIARSSWKHRKNFDEFYTILTSTCTSYLDKWFETDVLKATLATDAIIGSVYGPSTPGSNYVLLHHVMGSITGEKGIWAYLEGGMGALPVILQKIAEENGATVKLNSPVKSIEVDNNKAKAVVMENGEVYESNTIISNATPYVTYEKLLSKLKSDPAYDSQFKSIESVSYESPVTKINLAINKLPTFKCLPQQGLHLGATIHIGSSSMNEIEVSFKEYQDKKISSRPIIEMTIPSVLDKTLAPDGRYIVNLFTQNTPYSPEGKPWTDKMREDYAEKCFDMIEELAPGFKSSVVFKEVLTPPDLEKTFGLTGGNIFHGEMSLHRLYWNRPGLHEISQMTPIDGLFLCGSGSHPGGGVMGAPGRNCAKVLLELGKQ